MRRGELVSVRKSELIKYVGCHSSVKLNELNQALRVTLSLG